MIALVSMTSDGASATLLGSFTCGNSARYFISIVTFNLIQTTCIACCQWGWVRIRVSGSSSSGGSASARAGTSGSSGSSVSVSTSARCNISGSPRFFTRRSAPFRMHHSIVCYRKTVLSLEISTEE